MIYITPIIPVIHYPIFFNAIINADYAFLGSILRWIKRIKCTL
jgi:hypothetical protein